MKNLFMLAMALIMTCTIAFAQSPASKGEAMGKKITKVALFENEADFEQTMLRFLDDLAEYGINEDEASFQSYLEGVAMGMVKECEANGLSEDDAMELFDIVVPEDLAEVVISRMVSKM